MLTLLNRLRVGNPVYWLPRLHVALLLLAFAEMIGWQDASTFSPLGWVAVVLIYVALTALLMDVLVRWRVDDLYTLFLTAGIFALLQGTLISLAAVGEIENVITGLLLRTLGLQTALFLLAFAAYYLLSSGKSIPYGVWLVAAGVGLFWGVWAKWFPELETVTIQPPDFDNSLPLIIVALMGAGILPALYQGAALLEMTPDDWRLTRLEGAVMLLILVVAGILRVQYMDLLALAIVVSVLVMLAVMLFFTRNSRHKSYLDAVTPSQAPQLVGWVALAIPFGLAAALSYNLTNRDIANLIFGALAIFGAAWLPLVSVLMGVRLFTQLTRQGY